MTGKKIQTSSEDRLLPIANVGRIMKKSLPSNAKISKEAKETVQECVSEFISFITGEASDKCQTEKRKTINGDDLLWAMTTLGFENYVGPLKAHLHKYRDNVEADNSTVITQQHSPASDDDTVKVTDNLDGFNNGFQAQVSAKGRGDNYNLNFGYGDNLASVGFDITKSYEIDGNVKGIVATDIHHGIQW